MPELPLLPFENTPYSDPLFPGIEIPDANPQDEPLVCLTYNQDWQPILIALCSRLTRYDAWVGNLDNQKLGVRKANEFIAQIQQEHCPEGATADLCTEYLPLNPFTTYFPLSPYVDTEFIPPGYQRRPFYTNVTNILLDIQPTDVIVDTLALNFFTPIDELVGFSFPRIHIDLTGSGKAELHFLQLPQGGFATITIDGNPFQAKIVNLNALALTDVETILGLLGVIFGGGLATRYTHELEFETAGDHTIDIVFYPHVGGDVIIGFGGGFAGLEFCSNSLDGDQRYMAVSGIRVNTDTCKWQQEFNGDGVWVDYADVYQPLCVPSPGALTLIRDPGDGQLEQSTDGGGSYADIPNAHFLHIAADNDPLTGGLTIQSTDSANPSLIVIQPIAVPTQPLISFRKSDGSPLLELLANLRLRFYGSVGNMTLDQAGNDFNFSRVGANFISAITAPGTIITRVGGITSFCAHQNGRTTFGHIEQRDATTDILSQNPAWPGLSVRAHATQSANIAEFKVNAAATSAIRPDGSAKIHMADGNVNSAPDAILIDHNVGASTPLANFGSSMRYQGKSSTTDSQNMALLAVIWETATHATRKAKVTLDVWDTAPRRALSAGASGSEPTIGFLGAPDAIRQQLGVIDCEGSEAAKAALDKLKVFGLIDGTFNLGTFPEPTPVPGTGVGIQVPDPLPAPTSQSDGNLCSAAKYLGNIWGKWAGWLILISQTMTSQRDWLDAYNADTLVALETVHSGLNTDWFSLLTQGNSWYLTHDTEAQTLLITSMADFGASDLVANAIFSGLKNSADFDQNCLSLIQQYIGFIDSDYSFPLADALGLLPIEIWQRLYWIGIQGTEEGCFEGWIVDMDFNADDWSGAISFYDGLYAPPYTDPAAPAPSYVRIDCVHFAITGATIYWHSSESMTLNIFKFGGTLVDQQTVNGTGNTTWLGDAPDGLYFELGDVGEPAAASCSFSRLIVTGTGEIPTMN